MPDAELPDIIGHDEVIARHCRQSNHFTKKYLVFMPPRHGRLSVFRCTGLGSPEIQEIGVRVVATDAHPVKGHATIVARTLTDEGLEISAATEAHPRHANVTGWGEDEAAIRLTAKKLADAAIAFVKY